MFARIAAEINRRDPDRVALRRAARIAIAVPFTVLTLSAIPSLQDSSLYGTFGVLALLVFADYGGPLKSRFLTYLVTTLIGAPLVVLGQVFAQQVAASALVMFAVAMAIGLAGTLRGVFGAGQSTLLLVTVLALTSPPGGSLLLDLAAWFYGGLVAAVAAVVLWPAQPRSVIRIRLGRVYSAAADAVRRRWGPQAGPVERAELVEEVLTDLDALRAIYDGNLLRPSGATATDRALAGLVEEAYRLVTFQRWRDVAVGPRPEPLRTADAHLAESTAQALERVGPVLLSGAPEMPADAVARARQDHLGQVSDWIAIGHPDAEAARAAVDDSFPIRITSVTAEMAIANAAVVRGRPARLSEGPATVPSRGPWQRLRDQLSWRSPWLRNSLRSAIALSISVALANALGLGHAFWIVLGTLSALRFDAMGTGRTAIQGLLGTTAGVLVGAAMIAVIGDNHWAWAAVLPIVVFIVGYTKGGYSVLVGQAAFSVAVITLFSFIAGADFKTAELRFLEVALGLGISLVVSAMLWPRGVVAMLNDRVIAGMDAAADHLVAAADYLTGGYVDAPALARIRQHAMRASSLADETYDLAVAQQPPESVPMSRWAKAASTIRHVNFAAALVPRVQEITRERGGDLAVPPVLVGPLLTAANGVRASARSGVRAFCGVADDSPRGGFLADLPRGGDDPGSPVGPVGPAAKQAIADLRAAIDGELRDPPPWHGEGSDPRPALLAWLADWAALLQWAMERMAADFPEQPNPRA